MSSFDCEKCGAPIIDTPKGYVTECEHYPLDLKKSRKVWWEEVTRSFAAQSREEGK